MQTEEIFNKWRDVEVMPGFAPSVEYIEDLEKSKFLWAQLTLPDFSSFSTSSAESSRESSSISSPSKMGARSGPQTPPTNSRISSPAINSTTRPELDSINNEITPSSSKISYAGVDVNIPISEGKERVRGFETNVMTDAAMEQELRELVAADPNTYTQQSNSETLEKAKAIWAKGADAATTKVTEALGAAKAGMKLSPEIVPLARMVENELTRQGKVEDARRIQSDLAAELTYLGQVNQAARILRSADPLTKAQSMEKLVEKLNAQLTEGQKRRMGEAGKIVLDQGLVDKYVAAEDDAARDAVMDEIQQNIADQIPPTFMEKFTALRYLNMLGNLKTQARNIEGNVTMLVTSAVKNRVRAVLELAQVLDSGGKYQRNTSFFVNPKLALEAARDFDAVSVEAMGEGKYSDSAKQFGKGIQDKRRIFSSKLLEGARKGTNWAMEAGDKIFLRATYADTLGGYLQAHGVKSISEASPEMLEAARKFAIKEAQEATFRDSNVVSEWASQLGRGQNTPKGIKVVSEGIAPFRKTPANVAVRAEEYSPLGIVNTIVTAAQAQKGKATTADVINSASKTVTGTIIFAAGILAAMAGAARGKEDDEALEQFQKQQGEQDYSIQIGDTSVSLTQLSPSAIPFFMGVSSGQEKPKGDALFGFWNIQYCGIYSRCDWILAWLCLRGRCADSCRVNYYDYFWYCADYRREVNRRRGRRSTNKSGRNGG